MNFRMLPGTNKAHVLLDRVIHMIAYAVGHPRINTPFKQLVSVIETYWTTRARFPTQIYLLD